MRILAADHVLPVSSKPIENGAVVISDSRIVAVGKASDLRLQFPEASFEDFGEAAILPGFVNCHSHLELTAMRGLLDNVEHDFSSWLLTLNAARQKMTDLEVETAATAGVIEGARAGVTCFGDIGRFGRAGLEALKRVGLRGVLFQETEFSPDNKTASEDFEMLRGKFIALNKDASALVEIGLSPHSPYTVSPKLFELLGNFAQAEKIKVTIHASESAQEKSLIEKGQGFFIELYKKFDLEWQSPHCSSIEFLDSTGILKSTPLLAHCVTVSDSDIETIRRTGTAVAHCPKSNAKFGHGAAPLEKFLNAGIPVGLGSDSVASNNICDMLEEARFASLTARNRPGSDRFIVAAEILEAATLGGAKALGLDEKIGTLEPQKQADICVLSLKCVSQMPIHAPHEALVFASNARDVVMTMVGGDEIFREGEMLTVDDKDVLIRLTDIGAKLRSS